MKFVEIQNTQQFDSLISSYQHPILVYFTATWCRPCFELQRMIEEKLQVSFGWIVAKINVDIEENEDIIARHEISSIPSVFLYQNGDIVEDKDAFFQGCNAEALTRMIELANNNSPKPLYQASL
ncbi:thioredoxin (macronuclear) [Tetrahymena thermophila SB210]|uniref:Thioredoxin n=1 Tax=Tetrahymena thermophila (strain SB210) TaxID=312017 RepID=I7LX92_TETTS|nr:thioredoxin [Tetrahymena thermophila SB210]EAS03989.1 thioredoxin [Tetrahymena thermophila SB210]|eukprot:XP_001024234.1 thioredoxin [Tetrahymena thermophila SB210]